MSVTHVAVPGSVPETGEGNKVGASKWAADHVITDIVAAGQLTESFTITATAGTVNKNLWQIFSAPNAASGEVRGFYLDLYSQPTAAYASFATAGFISVTHDAGAFDHTNGLRGLAVQAVQNLAGTTVAAARGVEAVYRAAAGTITEGIALLVARGFAGDAGTIGQGTGIKILAHASPAPTTDVAIQSLGGMHIFVGNVKIGANAVPNAPLDLTGDALLNGNITVGASAGAGKYLLMFEMTAPGAPPADSAVLYLEDTGAGKTRLAIKFATGAAIVLATQA